jgi:predicted DNA-binding transcriptional regulator AlpA
LSAEIATAIPLARLVEASPDLVGLTDAALWAGVSRQNMRQLMISHIYQFPLPVHSGSASIWHLSDILDWLKGKGGYQFDERVHEVARMALLINLGKESKRCVSLSENLLV